MKTTVIIIATLHQFHLKSQFYSLNNLRTIIEKINPDVICVELTEKDLKDKTPQTVKIEYPQCILPLSQEKGYILFPMEPDEPDYSMEVKRYQQLYKRLGSKEPDKIQIFNQYTEALYDYLFSYWNSHIDVNSSLTDALFEVKHNFQESLFGSTERKCWKEWNTHFLNAILKTCRAHKDKTILVTVGVEHVYWIKKHLKANQKIELIGINELLCKYIHFT